MQDNSFQVFLVIWNNLQHQTTPAVHLKICAWLEKSWHSGDTRLLLMAFRSCGKSTLVGLFCAWLLWRQADLRILVLAADLNLARKMVRNVKRIIEKHPLTKHLKPAQADQWGAEKFTVRRKKELRDPSMLAKGITTNLTGTRADLIICDDVEVPNTCDTPEKREELRERLLELDYILVPGGTQLYAGTPHSWYTIYAEDPRREIGEERAFLEVFKRLVIPVLDAQGKSAWPERYTLEGLEAVRRKTGPNHFTSQMLCQPVNIANGHLDPADLQLYDAEIEYSEAAQQPVLTLAGRRMVSASAWWDPAFGREGGDRSILAIIFADGEGQYWLHHVAQIKISALDPDAAAIQQCRQVAQIADRFHLPGIALETNGLGKFLPGLLQQELGKAGLVCRVREVTSRRPKALRILEAFDAPLAARVLHVHRSVLVSPFMTELQEWRPGKTGGHDDALDAVAGALSLEPVRLGRVHGTKRQKWGGRSRTETATTEFEV